LLKNGANAHRGEPVLPTVHGLIDFMKEAAKVAVVLVPGETDHQKKNPERLLP
jgi:hypothetical protein